MQKPYLVNGANALTFCLMVVSCFFSSVIVRKIGIKNALIFGTLGYAPYAAGLYTNNRFGTEWFVLFGAALCGISAGVFWMAEAAIALSYPEPYNQGRFLGFWLSFRVGGQVVGGVSVTSFIISSLNLLPLIVLLGNQLGRKYSCKQSRKGLLPCLRSIHCTSMSRPSRSAPLKQTIKGATKRWHPR
jgi:MFS family permease